MQFKKAVEEEEMGFQMAPMIDCVFQLLVFFMCISSISNIEVGQKILLPVADKAKEAQKTQKEVMIGVDTEGKAYLQGNFYDKDELIGMLIAIKDERGAAPKVVIRGDRNTNFKAILKVMDCCAEAGIWDVAFATYQTEPAGGRKDL